MKAEIDKITQELIDKCREIHHNNSELLLKYKQDVQSLYDTLNGRLDTCKQSLVSNKDILVIDTEQYIHKETKHPKHPKFTTIKFATGQLPSKQLHDDFGSLSVKDGQEMLEPQEVTSHQLPMSDVVTKYRSNDSTVVSEFTHSSYITSVEKSTSDNVWVLCDGDKNISLVNQQDVVIQKLELDSNVHDISVSPATGSLWLCCYDKTIYEVSSKTPTKRFTTNSNPWGLSLTPDNNVVVGTLHNVTVYSTTGQVLHTTHYSGEHMVVSPHHVTVCTSTGDTAVCDRDLSKHGGTGKPNVSAYNSKLEIKYQYYGSPQSQGHTFTSEFYPYDAVYDSQGNLLIADNNIKCIQLVSGEGQFLTVVHTDQLKPRALTLLQDGLLFVGYNDKKIKVIQYRL